NSFWDTDCAFWHTSYQRNCHERTQRTQIVPSSRPAATFSHPMGEGTFLRALSSFAANLNRFDFCPRTRDGLASVMRFPTVFSRLTFYCALLLAAASSVRADTTWGYIASNAFPTLVFSNPVSITSPPGETNRLFILEKHGRIIVITNLAAPT